MIRLKDRTTCPPNGFMFHESKTGWESRRAMPESRWDFRQLCKAVREYRMSHPELNLSVNPVEIALEVDADNARRLSEISGAEAFIIRDVAPMHYTPHGPIPSNCIVIRRSGALGDVLCASALVAKFYEHGIGVIFQSGSDMHCILRRVPGIAGVELPHGEPLINLDGAYEDDPNRQKKTFSEMFVAEANRRVAVNHITLQPTNCTPKITVTEEERQEFLKKLSKHPKPWVMICPKSNSWANRTVPNEIWEQAANKINGTKFWLGMNGAPPGIIDLHCRHFDNVMALMASADLLVTVDTGPMHVAAALRIPIVTINQSSSPECHLSDQNDFTMVSPELECLNCQQSLCHINRDRPPCQIVSPELIAESANRRASSYGNGKVSVVIPCYKPTADRLNRCLAAVLPQVDEIVVVFEKNGVVPEGVIQDKKIKLLVHPKKNTGFGRNINYGIRHTDGEFILFLNDDCFLDPGCVETLKNTMAPDTGIVTHLLRYPNGTVQYAGKLRELNVEGPLVGWGHIDWKAKECRYKEPVEQETICGASVLIRRKAFYQARGFDEDYRMYCEDDDLGLRVRQAGWKIFFTPHATGIHDEHQSSRMLPEIGEMMNHSVKIFHQKWDWYIRLNRNVPMGVFQ